MSDERSHPRRILDDEARCKANCRFKRGWAATVYLAVLLSVGLHLGLFEAFPRMETRDLSAEEASSTEVVEIPPDVRIPPPPEQVARPAEPKVATTDVAPEATTPPTDFEEQPRRQQMPAPPSVGSSTAERPSFIPRDVDPKLRNESELLKLLKRHYPPALAEAGIGGRIVLWVFVDTDGEAAEVRIRKSSGYEKLDRAAREVAKQMTFEPAQSRDKPIAVWVAQTITFSPSLAD